MLNIVFYCDLIVNVGDVMIYEVLIVYLGMLIVELVELLSSVKLRVYLVVDEGRLVGIINCLDVL